MAQINPNKLEFQRLSNFEYTPKAQDKHTEKLTVRV